MTRELRAKSKLTASLTTLVAASLVTVAAGEKAAFADAGSAVPVWSEVASLYSNSLKLTGALPSISNDTIAIGRDVFERTGATSWRERAAPLGLALDYSYPVSSISGDTIVLGSPGRLQSFPVDGAGVAYAFVRVGAEWAQQGAALAAAGTVAFDDFGATLALSGDTVVIGARSEKVAANVSQGAAYVFQRSAGAWQQQGPALVAADGMAADYFGSAVAISGDTLIVGAPGVAPNFGNLPSNPPGRAYVFVRTGGVWSQQGAALTPAAPSSVLGFGNAVASSGDTVLIGAPGGHDYPGAAQVFVRSGSTWAPQGPPLVQSELPYPQDDFGSVVSLVGDVALVSGRAGFSFPTAYVFARSGESWTQQGPRLMVTDGMGSFSGQAALSGTFAVLGNYVLAPGTDETLCAHDADCPNALFCASNGVCRPPLEPGQICDFCMDEGCRVCDGADCDGYRCERKYTGQTCTDHSDCATGHCDDHVCCETACGSLCASCAEQGSEGKCVVVTGAPRQGHGECRASTKSCAGTCDGREADACNYNSCSAACASEADCAPGDRCEQGDCVSGGGAGASGSSGEGGEGGEGGAGPSAGGPSASGATGACANAGDCSAPGGACDAAGDCGSVATPADNQASDGCSCRTGALPTSNAAALLGLALAAAGSLRRVRRAKRVSERQRWTAGRSS